MPLRQSACLRSSLLARLLILQRAGFWLIDRDAICVDVTMAGRDWVAAGFLFGVSARQRILQGAMRLRGAVRWRAERPRLHAGRHAEAELRLGAILNHSAAGWSLAA